MTKRQQFKAKMIVAYQDGEHRLLQDGCLVVDGNEVVHVGKSFDGSVDETIDAGDCVITPGFINTHTHLSWIAFGQILHRGHWQPTILSVWLACHVEGSSGSDGTKRT